MPTMTGEGHAEREMEKELQCRWKVGKKPTKMCSIRCQRKTRPSDASGSSQAGKLLFQGRKDRDKDRAMAPGAPPSLPGRLARHPPQRVSYVGGPPLTSSLC